MSSQNRFHCIRRMGVCFFAALQGSIALAQTMTPVLATAVQPAASEDQASTTNTVLLTLPERAVPEESVPQDLFAVRGAGTLPMEMPAFEEPMPEPIPPGVEVMPAPEEFTVIVPAPLSNMIYRGQLRRSAEDVVYFLENEGQFHAVRTGALLNTQFRVGEQTDEGLILVDLATGQAQTISIDPADATP